MSTGVMNTGHMGGTMLTLAALGASVFPTKITPPPGCAGGFIYAQSGTVSILPDAVSGASVGGATAYGSTITTGYFLPTGPNAAIAWNGPAAFYIAAAGVATVAVLFRFSETSANFTQGLTVTGPLR